MPVELEMPPQAAQPAPGPAREIPPAERLSLMDVWRVLMKQRIVILVVTLLTFAGVTWRAYRTPPVYESVARIQIRPQQMTVAIGQSEQNQSGEANVAMATAVRILQSDSVLFETARNLKLLFPERSDAELTPPQRNAMIGIIKGGLSVQVIQGTNIVEVHYRGGNPKLTAAVANQLADTYSDFDLQTQYERTAHISTWLQEKLEGLKNEASDAQRALTEYQRAHGIVGTDENSNLTIQTMQQISTSLNSAEADRIMKEARMRDYDSLEPRLAALVGDNPNLIALHNQVADLQVQRDQLAAKYGRKNPRMIDLQAQISKAQSQLEAELALSRRQVQDEYQGALGVEEALRRRLNQQEDAAYKLTEGAAQYAILRNQAQLTRELYNTLQLRLKEATVTAGLTAANITVVDSAQVPYIPIAPRKRVAMTFGLLGGLLAGCVLAFLIESIDDRLQTSDEIEQVSGFPALAAIPEFKMAQGNAKGGKAERIAMSSGTLQLAALQDTKSTFAEAFRNLRSSLLLSSMDNPPRCIVFTSAFPGEGKTTAAINTAIVFAQRGEKVLLVDADLRRGRLGQTFGITDRSFGLSSVLANSQIVREYPTPLQELPNFQLLPTGPRPPNPAEMLSSARMKEQLRVWSREYDRIIIDSAPVLPVSDTRAVAVLADAVVLVARANMTRKRALTRVRDLLLRINAPLAGVVVNGVDLRLENFYTYRYGMYGYSYYRYSRYGYGSPYSDRAYGYEDDEKGDN